jgi:hypothetical protein
MELFVRSDTDTAHPQASVPIYFIHTMQQPFCARPGCWCQAEQARIGQLLASLKNNELCVAEAASFTDGKAK